jgi:hypothetical protein
MRTLRIVCSMLKVRTEHSQPEQLTLVSTFRSRSDDVAPCIPYTVTSSQQLSVGREVSLDLLSNSSTLSVKLDQRWVATNQREFGARESNTGSSRQHAQ